MSFKKRARKVSGDGWVSSKWSLLRMQTSCSKMSSREYARSVTWTKSLISGG